MNRMAAGMLNEPTPRDEMMDLYSALVDSHCKRRLSETDECVAGDPEWRSVFAKTPTVEQLASEEPPRAELMLRTSAEASVAAGSELSPASSSMMDRPDGADSGIAEESSSTIASALDGLSKDHLPPRFSKWFPPGGFPLELSLIHI